MDEKKRRERLANAPGVMGMFARQIQEAKEAEAVTEPFPILGRAKLERMFDDEDEPAEAAAAETPAGAPTPLSDTPLVEAKLVPIKDEKKSGARKEKPLEGDVVTEIDPDLVDLWTKDGQVMNDRPNGEFGDMDSLTSAILRNGQEVPGLVRPTKGGRYQLIYGRRRLTICRELGIKFKVRIRDLDDRQALIAMWSENADREGLSSWAKAISYQNSLDRGVFPSQTALAADLGITKSALSNILTYNRLPKALIEAVGDFSKVGIMTARTILSLSEDQKNIPLLVGMADEIRAGTLHEKKLARAVEQAKSPADTAKPTAAEKGSRKYSLRQTERGVFQITLSKDLTRDMTVEELQALLDATFK